MKKILLAVLGVCVSAIPVAFSSTVDATKEYAYDCKVAESLLGKFEPHMCGFANRKERIITTKSLTIPTECSQTITKNCDRNGYEMIRYNIEYGIIKNVATIINLDAELNKKYKKINNYLLNGTPFYPVSRSPFTFDVSTKRWEWNSPVGELGISQLDIDQKIKDSKYRLDKIRKNLLSTQRAWITSKEACFTMRELPQTPYILHGNKTSLSDSGETPFYECFIQEYEQRIRILNELERRLNPENMGE